MGLKLLFLYWLLVVSIERFNKNVWYDKDIYYFME